MALGADYYIDSRTGEDTNNGKTPTEAWASLDKVNSRQFQPGDRILFAAGSIYHGQLEPKGCGVAGEPILIDRYGEGSNPAIHGDGRKPHTLLLENVEYWEARNLEITNKGKKRGRGRRGVIIRARDFGDCHHIILEGLEIHDVNGLLYKEQGGGSGILWENGGQRIPTRFVGLQILNCHIHNCQRNAINSRGNTKRDAWYPSLEVVIRGNLIENIPGDCIVPIGTDGALVEYNVVRRGVDILPEKDAAAGIWPWSCDNTLIQFNEASDHRAKWDGQGFDVDWNCIGTVMQYNYSHDNWGGFLLVCNNGKSYGSKSNIGTRDSVIRYNLSVNDGLRPYKTAVNDRFFSPTFHITGPVENTRIERNIIIMPHERHPEIENTLIEVNNWGGPYPLKTVFCSNVVRNPSTPAILWKKASRTEETDNDISADYPFGKLNPLKLLDTFKDHPAFREQEGYAILREFISHRQQHPDPRFAPFMSGKDFQP